MAHHHKLAGHPAQTRLLRHFRQNYYWPHMAADCVATVIECGACAKNRVHLLKRRAPLKRFPAIGPLESVSLDILGPLQKSKRGFQFILVITDRFKKLTQAVPLRRIRTADVAAELVDHWVLMYGPPTTLLSDDGSQFAFQFFTRVCEVLNITNAFTTTYHPQISGQAERFNRTLLAMLRCYVVDNPGDWCEYVGALCFAYNTAIHRATRTTPFDLVLCRPPRDFIAARRAPRHHSRR